MREGLTKTGSREWDAGYQLGQGILNRARVAFGSLLRKAQSSESLLYVEERISIGPKKMLILVNCAGRRFLLATAGDNVTPIIEVAKDSLHRDALSVGHGDGL